MTEQQQKSSVSSSSKFFIVLTLLFASLAIWTYVAKLDITFQAPGIIQPETNSTTIDTMVAGQIELVKIRQGDIVSKDDIIVVINPGVGYEKYNVVANVDGRVQTLNYKNPGAVVKKGEPILTIVPEDQKMIVIGKLCVCDRGYIEVGQDTKVKLADQDAMKFAPLPGKVINISPDAVMDQTGTFYEIEVELQKQKFTNKIMEYKLIPGINVQIFILTGERTVLSYITSPFHNSIGQALQER